MDQLDETDAEIDIEWVLRAHYYELLEPLGCGKFGKVYLVKSLRYNQKMAAKIINTETEERSKNQEIEQLLHLSHPNIIRFYDYWNEGNSLFIIMQYCERGSIKQFINKNGPIKIEQLRIWYRQILEAINFCHQNCIVHMDIKPENIMIDEHNRAQLVDFGLSRYVENGLRSTKICGTLSTMSPEMILRKPYDPIKSEIWSLGITFYCMAVGNLPWDTNSIGSIKKQILYAPVLYPNWLDSKLCNFLKCMLVENPNNRLSTSQLLSHEFLKEGLPFLKRTKKISRSISIGCTSTNQLGTSNKIRSTPSLLIMPWNLHVSSIWNAKSEISTERKT